MVRCLLAYFVWRSQKCQHIKWNYLNEIFTQTNEKRKLATRHTRAIRLNNSNRCRITKLLDISHKSAPLPYRLDEIRSKLNAYLIYVLPVDIRPSFSLLIFITACLLHFTSILLPFYVHK